MNKMIFLAAVMFFLAWAGPAGAHPPTQIQLSYHAQDQLLHVTMQHVTRDPREHRIREIVVFVNGKDVGHHFFVQQTSARGLDEEIAVAAEAGDVIGVKAVCSQAGVGKAELTVPAEEE